MCGGGFSFIGSLIATKSCTNVWAKQKGAEMPKLPASVRAERIGHWSMGRENEYDASGMLSPITWTCNCGSHLTLEVLDQDADQYILVSKEERDQFLSKHGNCTATCYKCHTAPVERYGLWCQPCEDKEY
jgi:hypothetical protein